MQDRISINLLPLEILIREKQTAKFVLIKRISIILLSILILFTSVIMAFKILQGQLLKQSGERLVLAESRISELKDKEFYALALKYRLSSIEKLVFDPKKVALFNLIVALTPADVTISQFNLDKNSTVSLSLTSFSLVAVDEFISNLGNKEKTSDLVTKVDLESFARGRDGLFRLSLKITPR